MTCTKAGCLSVEVGESKIGGIVVIACGEHAELLRGDEKIHQLFREAQRYGRQLAILIDALRGPAADVQACFGKLDQSMRAEEALQDAIEDWLRSTGSLPS